jgi:hypothetical protein
MTDNGGFINDELGSKSVSTIVINGKRNERVIESG